MIELDMFYVSYFGDFLSKGSRESFEQNILFRLSRQEKPPGRPESCQARPGPHLKAAAKAGQAWPLRNTGHADRTQVTGHAGSA